MFVEALMFVNVRICRDGKLLDGEGIENVMSLISNGPCRAEPSEGK